MRALLARLLRRPSPLARVLRGCLDGGMALEIGGPSRLFTRRGRLPLYDVLAAVDGVDLGAETVWSRRRASSQGEGREVGLPPGRRFAAEAVTLDGVPRGAYDAVLASHVLEHVANPLRALDTWREVLAPPGWLLLVVPHREGTFDHLRPVTSLAHVEEDRARDVGEDDLTHLDEILRLHDLERDPAAGTRAAFEARSSENAVHRCLHHHVFDTALVLETLGAACWTVEAVDVMRPYHIAVLARAEPFDPGVNEQWLAPGARWRRRSPFAGDRETARGAGPGTPHRTKAPQDP